MRPIYDHASAELRLNVDRLPPPVRCHREMASGEVHVADHVLVRVHTDDGVIGIADAPPLSGSKTRLRALTCSFRPRVRTR